MGWGGARKSNTPFLVPCQGVAGDAASDASRPVARGVKRENGVKVEQDSEDQEMQSSSSLAHQQTCFLLFSKFTKEVSVSVVFGAHI